MATTGGGVRGVSAPASPLAGVASVCAGVLCLTINDAFAKWLGGHYPVIQIVFFRMLIGLPLIMLAGMAFEGPGAFTTRRPLALVGRGLVAAGTTYTFFLGLTFLPLAETTAIAFAAPIFVSILAVVLLGERGSGTQWAVTLTGFVGVLIVVQPGTAAFTPAALIPVVTAVCYALLMVSARMLGSSESIWTMMFYATLVPLLVSALLVPWFWETPAMEHLPAFIGTGVFGAAAMTLITQGFRIGPAVLVAPFDYTGLIWSVVLGWVFWDELPSALSAVGVVLIAVSGIYLATRSAGGGTDDRRRGMPPARDE